MEIAPSDSAMTGTRRIGPSGLEGEAPPTVTGVGSVVEVVVGVAEPFSVLDPHALAKTTSESTTNKAIRERTSAGAVSSIM
jgi:hypothetical protein